VTFFFSPPEFLLCIFPCFWEIFCRQKKRKRIKKQTGWKPNQKKENEKEQQKTVTPDFPTFSKYLNFSNTASFFGKIKFCQDTFVPPKRVSPRHVCTPYS